MKKRLLSILLAACMVVGLLPGLAQPAMAAANGTGITGSGTEGSPYIITSADQLAYVAQQVNASGKINSGTVDAAAAYYELGNDINLAAYSNWTPIGNYLSTFKGKFDGVKYSISNLKINTTSTADNQYYGLFGNNQSGTIINVSLTGINITVTNDAGELRVGGLVGYNNGTILNCSVTGTLAGAINPSQYIYTYWGGLVGENSQGTLKNCYSAVSVSVTGIANPQAAGNPFMGGVAGRNTANSEGRVLNNYWLFTAQVPTGVDSMGGDQDRSTSAGFTGTDTLNGKVTVGGIETLSLREALNAGLGILARTDLYTWVSSESYPVLGSLWTPPTYTATVTVNKDGTAWSDSGKSLALNQGSTKKYDLTLSGSSATASALAGTYDVYDGAVDTGVNIVISNGGGNAATVNYYTLTLSAGAGTSSPTGGGIYLAGKSVPIDATVNAGYTWSKWTSSNTGLLSDKSTKSTSIIMPVGAITLTATSTLDSYTINYILNGGMATNPPSYQYTTGTFTLNNPTRTGYSFVGWSGTSLTGNANTTVTIAAGSTGNRSYTANWKADAPSSAPLASIVTAKTDTSLTITTQAGYEYSVDNGAHWYSGTGSYTFTDLSPNSPYNLVYRKAAVTTGDISSASDASAPLSVTTKSAAASVPTPTAPTIGVGADKPTSSSITVGTAAGNEYYISTSATADWSGTLDGYFKATVNGTHMFNSLSPATQYYIHVRVAETDTAMPSASSNVSQYTLPVTPTASDVTVDYKAETISFANNYEVSTSADFATTIASGGAIQPETTYHVRVKAASGAPASEAVSFAISSRPATPTAITADKTKNSITITPVAGQEYKIGTGTWQDSGTFTGLSANTDYTVSARVKAVSSGSISFASEVYSTTIKTKSDGSSGFALPSISVSPTYAPGMTLEAITLPAGWCWSAPGTVPTVINTGYGAIYTPSDTATVDYSGVSGYAVDGGGKVTITRVVPLTVNRATPTAADFTYTAPTTLGYDNTPKSAAATAKSGISGMGAVTVKYYKDDTEVAGPTDAGTYTVKISVAQGENYATVTELTDSAWTFTIDKIAQAPLSIMGITASVTCGDTFNLSTTGGSGTGDVTWAVTRGSSATVDTNTGAVTITGVGETTITATKAADGNHTEAVTVTYTFTPAKRQLTLAPPSAAGGWTKTYDGKTDFDTSIITVGGITNKVGTDTVIVAVQSVSYDTAAVGVGDKALTITYSIEGKDSGNYLAPTNTVISNASITAATPTIKLEKKIAVRTDKIIEIDAATVTGAGSDGDISKNYSGAITYTYYTKEACADADRTTTEQSGAQTIGGAPKNIGTYYVKATIAVKGNYTNASSAPVTLTIYKPSSGGGTSATAENNSSSPVIVDGKVVEIGKSEVKGSTTTVKVDQNKLTEQIKNAKDSVFIPITAKTDTATAQLMVQNVEDMAAQKMALTVQSGKVAYHLDTAAIDTKALANAFSGTDTKLIPFQVTIANSPVKVEGTNIIIPPLEFTITASYGGKTVEVDTFKSFINRTVEISAEQAKKITTAVVVEKDGTLRHVPTNVMQKNGKYYAVINSLTNSTYTLIENEVKFTDASGKWYEKAVNEMGSRKTIGGIGDNRFAGDTSVTRAEFAAILVRALGLPTDSTAASVFTDVSSSQWYYGAVGTAYAYDLVSGKREDQFDPNANITRQEAMAMIARAAKVANYTGSPSSLADFSDAGMLGSWAVDSAKFNVGAGLIVGNNENLRPQDPISRAETATVILRLLQKAELVDVRN